MKKIFTICLILCAFASVSQAQIRLGVKGGGNLSFLIYDPEQQFDNRPSVGFHLGGFVHYGFAESLGIQVELLYSTQGGRSEGEFSDGSFLFDAEIRDNFNYLMLPILFKFTSSSGFTAEIGPSINFLLKAEETTELSSGGQNISTDEDIKELLTGTDIMLALGLGYELPSGLSFNGRFAFSLSTIFDEDSDLVSPEAPDLLNAVFQLGVGFPVFGN